MSKGGCSHLFKLVISYFSDKYPKSGISWITCWFYFNIFKESLFFFHRGCDSYSHCQCKGFLSPRFSLTLVISCLFGIAVPRTCSHISHQLSEMQLKTTRRYHLTPFIMPGILNTSSVIPERSLW